MKVRLAYCGTNSAKDRTVHNNKPDITICDNKQGTCISIDMAISADRNVNKKEAEKILKCKNLTVEITRT